MITRILSLLMLSLLLLGCRSETIEQPNPAVIVGPQALSTVSATSRPTPAPVDAGTAVGGSGDSPTPAPTVTLTSEPVAQATQPPPVADPADPTPATVESAYPEPARDTGSDSVWTYRIVAEYPHDTAAYTQGLVIEDNLTTLLEGTGRESSLRRVDLESGAIKQYQPLPEVFFGEGITQFGDRVFQLTWKSQMGFIYDSDSFEPLAKFYYPHQGWGLTHDGSQLIVSDGSDIIRFWDPETIQEVRRIHVADANGPVTQLNELEYVNGEIWANLWHKDLLARISPEDGRVLGWIDLSGLLDLDLLDQPEAVLNGIAYDEASGRLFVTGKLWPSLFEIEVFPPEGN